MENSCPIKGDPTVLPFTRFEDMFCQGQSSMFELSTPVVVGPVFGHARWVFTPLSPKKRGAYNKPTTPHFWQIAGCSLIFYYFYRTSANSMFEFPAPVVVGPVFGHTRWVFTPLSPKKKRRLQQAHDTAFLADFWQIFWQIFGRL